MAFTACMWHGAPVDWYCWQSTFYIFICREILTAVDIPDHLVLSLRLDLVKGERELEVAGQSENLCISAHLKVVLIIICCTITYSWHNYGHSIFTCSMKLDMKLIWAWWIIFVTSHHNFCPESLSFSLSFGWFGHHSPSFCPRPRPSWDDDQRQGWQRFPETTYSQFKRWETQIFWSLYKVQACTIHVYIHYWHDNLRTMEIWQICKRYSNLPTSVLRSATCPLKIKKGQKLVPT